MASGRAMVDDGSWLTVQSDSNRRAAMAGLKTAELGACRCGGHDAGRHANALRASGLAP
jgi:hypothetical protein